MEINQIKASLSPFVQDLTAAQMEQVCAYLELLMKWNAKINLTAVRRPEEMVTRHFGESFFAAKSWLDSHVSSVIDLGSGAGFPGLPMAIYSPQTKVTLIESQNKKATFLKEVVRELGMTSVTVFNGRGEDYRDRASLVTMRAVEKFGQALEVAAALVARGGKLGLMIGAEQQGELPDEFKWEVGNAIPGTPGRILVRGTRKKESDW